MDGHRHGGRKRGERDGRPGPAPPGRRTPAEGRPAGCARSPATAPWSPRAPPGPRRPPPRRPSCAARRASRAPRSTGRVSASLLDSGAVDLEGLGRPGVLVHGPDFSSEGADPDLAGLDTFGHGTHLAGHAGVAACGSLVGMNKLNFGDLEFEYDPDDPDG